MIQTDQKSSSVGKATTRQVPRLALLDFLKGEKSDRDRFVDQLFVGLKDYGFIILTDHVVNDENIKLAYEMSHALFSLPLETKRSYILEGGSGQRGYTAFGQEHAKDYDVGDLKEFWHVGRTLDSNNELFNTFPKNIWPKEIGEFKKIMSELYQGMDQTSVILLDALGKALDLPETYFREMVKDGNSILRLIHYPPINSIDKREEGAVRAQAHGDINLITLLVGATSSGLQLLDRDQLWLDVESSPGEIVVDSGDMLSRITNEVIPSTIHRVINPDDSNQARYSMPFFVHPNPKAELRCIDSCRGSKEKYPPINSNEFLLQRLRDIGLMKS